jgi:hypothetical protein
MGFASETKMDAVGATYNRYEELYDKILDYAV